MLLNYLCFCEYNIKKDLQKNYLYNLLVLKFNFVFICTLQINNSLKILIRNSILSEFFRELERGGI